VLLGEGKRTSKRHISSEDKGWGREKDTKNLLELALQLERLCRMKGAEKKRGDTLDALTTMEIEKRRS